MFFLTYSMKNAKQTRSSTTKGNLSCEFIKHIYHYKQRNRNKCIHDISVHEIGLWNPAMLAFELFYFGFSHLYIVLVDYFFQS